MANHKQELSMVAIHLY